MRCLVVRTEDDVLRFPLPDAEARVGSDPTNDIVVAVRGVSRFHARFVPDPVIPKLFDLGSKNGLVVRGKRVAEVHLLPGLVVRAGAAEISLEDGETSDLEIGIELRALRGGRRRGRTDETEVTDTFASGSGRQDALALMRDAANRQRNEAPLAETATSAERIRAALGAKTVAFVDRFGGGLVIRAAAGAGLEPRELAAASSRGTAERLQLFDVGDTRLALHRWRGPGGCSVLVVMPDGLSLAPWQTELLSFVLDPPEDLPRPSPGGAQPKGPTASKLACPDGMVPCPSAAMTGLLGQIAKTVHSRMDVLILGETGTGKELIARMLHLSGPSPEGPFVAINCAAIPSELLESELFGVRGRVATGVDPQQGRILQAHGGTLLLDEIGELPPALQPKLLRFLQEREVHSIGAARPEKVDVRVLSTSNRDLLAEVKAGRFRADLYYRLRGLQFHVPPLRERREDIPGLAAAFAQRAADEDGKRVRGISRKAVALLAAHDWPGNVRELQSEVKRAVLFCPDGALLSYDHLGSVQWAVAQAAVGTKGPAEVPPRESVVAPQDASRSLREQVDELERGLIREALARTKGNKTRAASLLGVTRAGLLIKAKRLFGVAED